MSSSSTSSPFFYGAVAGFVECSVCHPLDTLKTRMQNRHTRTSTNNQVGFLTTARKIYTKEGLRGFYHGLTAVYSGVIPKNALRFYSFETYRRWTHGDTFVAGMLAGATEAILIVNPTEVCKLRIQAQYNSIRDTSPSSGSTIRYKNIYQTAWRIVRKEGIAPFYRGLGATILRQSTNQALNFYAFHSLRKQFPDSTPFLLGMISGSLGPLVNHPLDVLKTRIQCSETRVSSLQVLSEVYRNHGLLGFYKGLGPRLLRIVPGQGITFGIYEFLNKNL